MVLELRAECISGRPIALAQGMSRESVLAVFGGVYQAGIGRDGHAGRSDAQVNALLFQIVTGTSVCSCSLNGKSS
ncbi:hypothetical protein [Cryobacterium sp. TMT1-66-1]|uniref:hypothetical protein n=1 Tax=Cryobacterium sp. TMT1-66-1 TaxID=1259242 RepID=UPI00106CFF05|nr:hypothetical protein [Cryobacterium sp. TMT1-66-1]TFD07615.1 hypothetical protein E3T29_06975 [Cryobacterium sp. TMT1-66-1]